MQREEPNMVEGFNLLPFEMKVQGIDRTLVDKVFALCDYYLKNDVRRHSRHIYDIYKLLPIVPQTEIFRNLVRDVRCVRAMTNICPSAQPGVDISELLHCLVDNDIYKADYENVTLRILEEDVHYETAIEAVKAIAESRVFDE